MIDRRWMGPGVLGPVAMAAACEDPGVEEVDRGSKPIEARGGEVELLAAWDDEGAAHTLLAFDGEMRVVSVAAQGGGIAIADGAGAPLELGSDAIGAALVEAIAAGELDLTTLRADYLDE